MYLIPVDSNILSIEEIFIHMIDTLGAEETRKVVWTKVKSLQRGTLSRRYNDFL